MKHLYLLTIVGFMLFSTSASKAQKSEFSYFKMEAFGENTELVRMVNGQYHKEFFWNKEKCLYMMRFKDGMQLIDYNMERLPVKLYILKNEVLYVNDTYKHVDRRFEGESEEFQEEMRNLFEINRDVTKEIHGFECFQVIMKDPVGGPYDVEMFVTEALPNLPNHSPLPSKILNAQPLEINIDMFGEKIKVEISKSENNVDIEERLGINFNDARFMTDQEYIKMNRM